MPFRSRTLAGAERVADRGEADQRTGGAPGSPPHQGWRAPLFIPARPKRRKAYEVLALIIPALSFLQFMVIGRLYVPEIILLLLLPILVHQNPHPFASSAIRKTLAAGVLWLVAQAGTDIVRHTPFDDFARGWSKIAVTLLVLIAMSLLLEKDRRRIVMFAIGLSIGGVLAYFFNPNIYAEGQPWKFGVGLPITLLTVLAATWLYAHRSPRVAALAILTIAVVNGFMGHRSQAGVCLMTAVFVVVQSRRKARVFHLGWRHAALGVTLAAAALGCVRLYESAAQQGYMGETARQLYQWQSEGALGILVGGRPGVIAGLTAIADSPWIGHGSWMMDSEVTQRSASFLRDSGYGTMGQMAATDDSGMLHSHLVGSWVQAGILGAAFWLWIMALDVGRLSVLYQSKDVLTPLIAYAGILLAWDIIFSPFGADRRFINPFYITLLLSVSHFRERGWPRPLRPVSVNYRGSGRPLMAATMASFPQSGGRS